MIKTKKLGSEYKKICKFTDAKKAFDRFTNLPSIKDSKYLGNNDYFVVAQNSFGYRCVVSTEKPVVNLTDEYGEYKFDVYESKYITEIKFRSGTSGTRMNWTRFDSEFGIMTLTTVENEDGIEYKGAYYNAFMEVKEADEL